MIIDASTVPIQFFVFSNFCSFYSISSSNFYIYKIEGISIYFLLLKFNQESMVYKDL